ncbi:hypothetical protein TELCIR_22837, partial [Teladorsagia circumcincta]
DVNKCCIKHDNCYGYQMGKKFCDDEFCNCLDVATKDEQRCNREESPQFCNAVRLFGDIAYERAGRGPRPVTEEASVSSPEQDEHDYESTITYGTTADISVSSTTTEIPVSDWTTSET